MVDVWWAATSLGTGRFSGVDERSDVDDLRRRFEELRSRGRGYLEVRRHEHPPFPALLLGFQEERAVLHLHRDEAHMSLLVGDRARASEVVEVLMMDEVAEFSAAFAVPLDHAWSVVDAFARGQGVDADEWDDL